MSEPEPTKSQLKPGEVLGPDGKPCKVCTGFKAWTGGATKKKSSTATTTTTTTPTPTTTTLGSDCPPDVERLGRHTWTFLHTTASYFPPTPTAAQQRSMLDLLRALPTLYPCGTCADHLKSHLGRDPPDDAVKSRSEVERWMCRAHNEVNARLGKPEFECDNVGQRWRDGWQDGHCD
ncbi:hypothetical protein JCM11491_007156 [Sporobolomyces phaffii]